MCENLVIEGGYPLYGEVCVPSAKNSVLPLLAATILCDAPVCLEDVPCLTDVALSLQMLRHLGCATQWHGRDVQVFAGGLHRHDLPSCLTSEMRASVLFLAPILSRVGRVETGMPGGCRIGARPIDIHLDGLVQMGARVTWGEESLLLEAPQGLHAVDYTLRYPSVGATETLLLAAARTKGTTILRGVAREPEIVDLAAFLNACGARIVGAGSAVVTVQGVAQLQGARFAPVPDRIVAATLACAVASAGGEVLINKASTTLFLPVLEALSRAGCDVSRGENQVHVARRAPLCGIGRLFTGVYPAFPTDAAPLLAAALLCAKSSSSVEDAVFEHRFSCATGFAELGAKVEVQGRALAIEPCKCLRGGDVFAPDLRGGAALVVAALAAQGTTKIGTASYIARGYENIATLFSGIGGKITENSSKK